MSWSRSWASCVDAVTFHRLGYDESLHIGKVEPIAARDPLVG